MSLIIQWFFMVIGVYLSYQAARWPGFEQHIAVMALLAFGMAFRADYKKVSTKR